MSLDSLAVTHAHVLTQLPRYQTAELDSAPLFAASNTLAEMTLLLESMPVEPVAHYRAAHEEARGRLSRLPEHDGEVAFVGKFSYTPRKVLRRVLDHALDHLNQIEQWRDWQAHGIVPTPADGWAGSIVTLDEDNAPLNAAELGAWLWRIDITAHLLALRAETLTGAQLDWLPPNNGWTLRTVLHHVAWSERYYTYWLEAALPGAPISRYQAVRKRFDMQLEQALARPPAEGYAYIYGEESIYSVAQILQTVITAETAL